jgi:hypothetical protein
MKVYTYFQQVDKFKLGQKPWHLVEYWVSHWKSKGWEPMVLTIEDAKKHPYFPEYFKWIKKVKTVNPFEYEAACFLRHLAMSVVGGGLMTDTDVFNLTLQPGDLPDMDRILVLGGGVPCAVWGSAGGYEFLCKAMAPYCKTISSDMHMIQFFKMPNLQWCPSYPDVSGKMIHFPAIKIGIDKLEFVQKFFAEREAQDVPA